MSNTMLAKMLDQSGTQMAKTFTNGNSRFNQGSMDIGGMPWITLSVKGNKFTLRSPDGSVKSSKVGATMQMIILARADHVNRTFYEGVYDEDVSKAPDCFATNGTTPHPNSSSPQSDTCDSCPQNIKGSGDDDKSRACSFNVPVICVPVIKGQVKVDTPFIWRLNANTIFGKSISDAARFSFKDLCTQLRTLQVDSPLAAFVLEASFDEINDGMLKVVFQPIQYTTDEQAQAIEASEIDATQMLNDVIPIIPEAGKAEGVDLDVGNTGVQADDDDESEEEEDTPPPPKQKSSKKKVSKKKAASKPKPPAEDAGEAAATAALQAAATAPVDSTGEEADAGEEDDAGDDGWGDDDDWS